MEAWLERVERLVWGWPLLGLLLGTGLSLTFRLRGLPFRRMGSALRTLTRRESGDVSPVGALCTSLAATVGTGNIVGVGTALALGGPGALLWMEVSALTGLAIQYAEGYLAVRWREVRPDGSRRGGPFAYLSRGLGSRPLAVLFAALGALAGLFGVGTFVQAGSVCAALRVWLGRFFPEATAIPVLGRAVPWPVVLLGLGLTVGAGSLIFGGIRKISRVSTVLVPVMGVLYALCCLWVIGRSAEALPAVLGRIVQEALSPAAGVGGLLGTIQAGVSRGVFSNEAGIGTAPIAAASAATDDPDAQGLLSMTATVFDTFLLCTLTGLAILCTGAEGLGVSAAMEAFGRGLPFPEAVSMGLVVLCLGLFCFTTIVGWSCYGTACLDFLTRDSPVARRIYLWLYLETVGIAPYFPVQAVWQAATVCNGLMAVPNLIGLLLLTPGVKKTPSRPGRRAPTRRGRRPGPGLQS